MKIVQETVNKENFLELSLTPKEFEYIKDYMIVSKEVEVDGKPFNIGVKIELDEYEEEEIVVIDYENF